MKPNLLQSEFCKMYQDISKRAEYHLYVLDVSDFFAWKKIVEKSVLPMHSVSVVFVTQTKSYLIFIIQICMKQCQIS